MQVNLSEEQLKTLFNLLDSQIQAVYATTLRNQEFGGRRVLRRDLKSLEELREHLQQWEPEERAPPREAWEDYVETRQIPSNPPPGD